MVTNQKSIRVLIVEDEYLVARDLEELLVSMGHVVVGPVDRIDEALELAHTSDFDFAVLDINLAGTYSFPVADVLRRRGVPFVFVSGYGSAGLVDGYRNETALCKPYEKGEVANAIAQAAPADIR
jgi:CheY-like chemotaxis protein